MLVVLASVLVLLLEDKMYNPKRAKKQAIQTLNVTLTPQLVSVLLYTEISLMNGQEKYKKYL